MRLLMTLLERIEVLPNQAIKIQDLYLSNLHEKTLPKVLTKIYRDKKLLRNQVYHINAPNSSPKPSRTGGMKR